MANVHHDGYVGHVKEIVNRVGKVESVEEINKWLGLAANHRLK